MRRLLAVLALLTAPAFGVLPPAHSPGHYYPLRATVQASAAQTANNNSAAFDATGYRACTVTLNVSAASGTTPNLAVKMQVTDDGGTTWYDLTGATFTAVTAAPATQAISISNFGDFFRAASTITGTTPSFTYAIKTVCQE